MKCVLAVGRRSGLIRRHGAPLPPTKLTLLTEYTHGVFTQCCYSVRKVIRRLCIMAHCIDSSVFIIVGGGNKGYPVNKYRQYLLQKVQEMYYYLPLNE